MHHFTPVLGLVGGALLALGMAVMLVTTGRRAGLSGVIAGILRPDEDWTWRAAFVTGMLAVGAGYAWLAPATFEHTTRMPLPVIALAGVCVGLGTRLGNGCTSGHTICGMSRFSKRSILATLVYFGVGIVTASLTGALCAS